jgi:hypothetical protein
MRQSAAHTTLGLAPPARRIALVLVLAAALSGCGALAAPCRVGSAALKAVPLIGHAAAAPTDACAGAIDPP